MFNRDFFPTPEPLIHQMLEGYDLRGKTVLEPSAGKGDIVDVLQKHYGAKVIACEKHPELAVIVASKCDLLAEDFLTVKAEQVSHVQYIVMNPPFSRSTQHILHAFEIAPPGCKIVALCNASTFENGWNSERERIRHVVQNSGTWENIGNAFQWAERKTDVDVALIRMEVPGAGYEQEFEGFFTEEDAPEQQENAIMSYNAIRDIVNRYVAAVKLFDSQLDIGIQMNDLVSKFVAGRYVKESEDLNCFRVNVDEKVEERGKFKRRLQKRAWSWIFDKMDLEKWTTQGLKNDINRFVEQQQNVPFTMRNIYRMIEIVIGTTGQRMDKALLEVFEKLTQRYDQNRYHVEGWKTNSHYLVNMKFIYPYAMEKEYFGRKLSFRRWDGYGADLVDTDKALCFLMGENYDAKDGDGTRLFRGLAMLPDELEPGQWYYTHFFRIKGYLKGTVHVEFRDEEVWARFNQKIAQLKGYPLFEHRSTSKKEKDKQAAQDSETGKRYRPQPATTTEPEAVSGQYLMVI